MQESKLKRSNSGIKRMAELTRVEREPDDDEQKPAETKERNESTSTIDEMEMLEETSDTEDVFK